jgi:hypothetical protein
VRPGVSDASWRSFNYSSVCGTWHLATVVTQESWGDDNSSGDFIPDIRHVKLSRRLGLCHNGDSALRSIIACPVSRRTATSSYHSCIERAFSQLLYCIYSRSLEGVQLTFVVMRQNEYLDSAQ